MLYFFFLNKMSFLQRISFPFRIMFTTPPLDFIPGRNVLVKETLATGLNALYPRLLLLHVVYVFFIPFRFSLIET